MATAVPFVDESQLPVLAASGSSSSSTITPRAALCPLFPALSSAQRKNSSYDDGFTNVPNSSSITSTINRPGSRIPHIPLLAFWRLMGQILCVINLLEAKSFTLQFSATCVPLRSDRSLSTELLTHCSSCPTHNWALKHTHPCIWKCPHLGYMLKDLRAVLAVISPASFCAHFHHLMWF